MQLVEERAALPAAPTTTAAVLTWASAILQVLTAVVTKFGYRLNRCLPKDGSETLSGGLTLASYTTSSLPTGVGAGTLVFDATASKAKCWDGAAWQVLW